MKQKESAQFTRRSVPYKQEKKESKKNLSDSNPTSMIARPHNNQPSICKYRAMFEEKLQRYISSLIPNKEVAENININTWISVASKWSTVELNRIVADGDLYPFLIQTSTPYITDYLLEQQLQMRKYDLVILRDYDLYFEENKQRITTRKAINEVKTQIKYNCLASDIFKAYFESGQSAEVIALEMGLEFKTVTNILRSIRAIILNQDN